MKLTIRLLLLSILTQYLFAEIHVVDLAGGGDYTSIYVAVDEASAGDTVLISSGTYQLPTTEGRILVDKELHILGSGYDAVENGGTYIFASTQMFDFTANADGSTLRGLRLYGAGSPLIQIAADEVIIEENHITNAQSQGFLMHIGSSVSADTIRNNILLFNPSSSHRYGIHLNGCIDATISNNIMAYFSNNGGIYAYNSTNSVVSNNIFLHSQYAVRSYGVMTIVNNIFMNCSYGIYNDTGADIIFNNCFFNNTTDGVTGTNPILENPDFVNFDENDTYTMTSVDEDDFDFHLLDESPLIDGGYELVDFNDANGSQNDPGVYGWLYPWSSDNGAPSMPVINSISVTPSSVDPGGTISIEVIGRFGN